MNKKDRELLIEICRNIEYLAHDCAEHLRTGHGMGYESYPYFANIEHQVGELIEKMKEAKPC